ncbi:MAG: YdjY domain-containing protein [Chthoniobacteraceae bacterium]|nr:YdjY domain-containing protein [Chthoniobacteraceae bacterium]
MNSVRWLTAAICLSLPFAALAQEPPAGTPAPEAASGPFTVGKITVDKQAKTVRFPAAVNMVDGTVEYLLVTDKGKTHESLLSTAVSPYHLHIAMLLLGVQPSQEIKELPPEQLTSDSLKAAPELKGDKVDILISWKAGAEAREIRAEEWINNRLTHAPMAEGPWVYTGSSIYQKRFLAQEEGSIIALVTDPVALVNNPRAGRNDDTAWSVRKDKVLPTGTAVEVTFRLLASKTTPTTPSEK